MAHSVCFYTAYVFIVLDVFQKSVMDSWPGFDCVSMSPWWQCLRLPKFGN
jgi:hypothetical protein